MKAELYRATIYNRYNDPRKKKKGDELQGEESYPSHKCSIFTVVHSLSLSMYLGPDKGNIEWAESLGSLHIYILYKSTVLK